MQAVPYIEVRCHVDELRTLLSEADVRRRKSILRSFIDTITIDGHTVTIESRCLENKIAALDQAAVLFDVPSGGPAWTKSKTFSIEVTLEGPATSIHRIG